MIQKITEDRDGPLEICGSTMITGKVTGQVVVRDGAELRLMGQVVGNVIVKPGGSLVMTGTVKGEIVNEGGAVDIFGFAGRVSDTGRSETMVSRGAIIGGQRASRPCRLSAFNEGLP